MPRPVMRGVRWLAYRLVVNDLWTTPMIYRIFISHSHKDSALASEMKSRLKRRKAIYVFKANYKPTLGDEIPKRIIKKIKEVDLVLVIWSRHSSKSKWVNQEIGMALAGKREILLITLSRGLELPDTLKKLEKAGSVISLHSGKEKALKSIKEIIYIKAIKKEKAEERAREKAKMQAGYYPREEEDDYDPTWVDESALWEDD